MDRPVPADFDPGLATAELGPLGVQQVRLAGFSASATNDGAGLVRIGHLTHGRLAVHSDRQSVQGSAAFLFPAGPYAGTWKDLGTERSEGAHPVAVRSRSSMPT